MFGSTWLNTLKSPLAFTFKYCVDGVLLGTADAHTMEFINLTGDDAPEDQGLEVLLT